MLKPNNCWKWYFDTETRSLMLDLGAYEFRVGIAVRSLIQDAKEGNCFSVDDALHYEHLVEAVACLDVADNRNLEIVLNSVAAMRFHKPVMPKSWFFSTSEQYLTPIDGQVVTLCNSLNQGRFLVVENHGEASMCCCIEEGFQLDDRKQIKLGEVIKVMNDRMYNYVPAVNHVRYAQVG